MPMFYKWRIRRLHLKTQPGDSSLDIKSNQIRRVFLFIEIFGVQLESWKNVQDWKSLNPNAPTNGRSFIQTLDLPRDQSLEYIGRRMRTYFLAPETGAYTFYITCDDKCELNLSTNEKLENLVTLVTITRYTRYKAWTRQSEAISRLKGYR